MPPEPDLRAHIRARGYRPATVNDGVREAARAALREADDGYARTLRQWQLETGQLADPARFSFELRQRLRGIGWTPGRDVWRHHWLPCVDADVALIRRLVVTESGSRQ